MTRRDEEAPHRRGLFVYAAIVVLAGCVDEQSASCRKAGEGYASPAVSVADAEKRDGELLLVKGALIARGGRPVEICEELSADTPPRCEGAALRVEGLRDTFAFERGESEGDTQWWHGVTTAGRIDGDTVRYELDCRTRNVQQQLGEAIGREPEFNAYSSSVEAEMIDYGPLPRMTPPTIRANYGSFAVRVRTSEAPLEFLDDSEPGPRGVAWYLDGKDWRAIKLYGPDMMVLWWAESGKRLDERWERVDAIMQRVRID